MSSISSSSISSASSAASSISPTLKLQVTVSGLLDGQSNLWEQSRDVAVDKLGNVYVVGGTTSSDFPATIGDTTLGTGGSSAGTQGATDAFVTKLDSFGNIIWSRFLGGPNYDRAYAVEVDDQFNVYVAGRAGEGFPTTTGVIQPNFGGDTTPNSAYGKQDGFITKISPDGSTLIWSTYFGDSDSGIIRDMDVDTNGVVHVAAFAHTAEMNVYLTSNAAQTTKGGSQNSFYARIAANGQSVIYGTWLGGTTTGDFSANPAVRVLPDGSAYFLTSEPAGGAPITSGMRNYSGGMDFLVAKFSATGTMQFCTYLGGSADEAMDTHSLAVLPNGNAVVAAGTDSSNYPVTDNSSLTGSLDLSVSVLSSTGQILHSTLIGGATSFDIAEGVDTDSQGNIYITGATGSSDLPVTTNALKSTSANAREGLMLILNQDLSQKQFVSYDNIIGEYANRSSIVDKFDRWHIVGATWQMNPFPATLGLDGSINGLHAGFYRTLDVASTAPTNLPAKPAKIASGAALKIAVIGASTSACKNLVEGGYSLSDCWVNRLQTYLQSVRPGSSVVNLAVSGTGTCHGLPTNGTVPSACPNPDNSLNPKPIPLTTNNITQALSTNPDLVIVNYPHDYQIGVGPTIQNLLLIQAAANTAQVPVWFTTSQAAYADPASVNSRIQQRDKVQITFGDRAIDFWNPLVDPQGDGTMSVNNVNHFDDNHPNAEGHRLLFESVKKRLGL